MGWIGLGDPGHEWRGLCRGELPLLRQVTRHTRHRHGRPAPKDVVCSFWTQYYCALPEKFCLQKYSRAITPCVAGARDPGLHCTHVGGGLTLVLLSQVGRHTRLLDNKKSRTSPAFFISYTDRNLICELCWLTICWAIQQLYQRHRSVVTLTETKL